MALRGGLAGWAIGIALIAGAAAGYAAALAGWGPAGRATALIVQAMQQERNAHERELAGLRTQQDQRQKDEFQAHEVQQQERAVQSQVLEATLTRYEQVRARLEETRARLEQLEAEKLIQTAENQSMIQTIHARDQSLAALREQIAFYEQLLPAGPPGVVSVRQFDARVASGMLRYRVLLTRSADNSDDMFTGRLQFTARGLQAGRMVTVVLTPATVADDAGSEMARDAAGALSHDRSAGAPSHDRSLDVAFRVYQRAEGVLTLPPDLSLRTVTVNVLEGQTVRAKRDAQPPF